MAYLPIPPVSPLCFGLPFWSAYVVWTSHARIVLENKKKEHGENYKTICRFYGIYDSAGLGRWLSR